MRSFEGSLGFVYMYMQTCMYLFQRMQGTDLPGLMYGGGEEPIRDHSNTCPSPLTLKPSQESVDIRRKQVVVDQGCADPCPKTCRPCKPCRRPRTAPGLFDSLDWTSVESSLRYATSLRVEMGGVGALTTTIRRHRTCTTVMLMESRRCDRNQVSVVQSGTKVQ